MKKLALAICLLLASIAAQAQFEKGTMILNPSVTGLDFSYSKNDDAKFGIGAQAGTFLADGFALMVNAGADWSRPVDIYTLVREHVVILILQVFISVVASIGNADVIKVAVITTIGDWVSKPDMLISCRGQ